VSDVVVPRLDAADIATVPRFAPPPPQAYASSYCA
jgi:hypothetical protein